MTTLEQLKRRYSLPYLTLAEVRKEHLPHINTDKWLLELIRKGEINLHPVRLHQSIQAPKVIYLPDLAQWLDAALERSNEAA